MEPNEASAVGVFDDLQKAEQTIDELRRAGFSSEEIGIVGHMGGGTSSGLPVPAPPEVTEPEYNAIGGVWKGAIWGGIIGLVVSGVVPLVGVATGSRWFEIIGGIILGAVMGCALLAFGSLAFALPKSRFYARELERGRFIVTVKNPRRKDEAVALLRRQGIYVDTNA